MSGAMAENFQPPEVLFIRGFGTQFGAGVFVVDTPFADFIDAVKCSFIEIFSESLNEYELQSQSK